MEEGGGGGGGEESREVGSQMKRVSGGRKGSMSKAAKGSGEIRADNY